ncbi:hypothetical protein ACOME3_007746 [Neoechinorhynchus agilis]
MLILHRLPFSRALCPFLRAIKRNLSGIESKKILSKLDQPTHKQITYTCKKCDRPNSAIFSRLSFEKGIVIVRCEGCRNLHLIADHLSWFPDAENALIRNK